MEVESAQLAASSDDDRIVLAGNAVIVLDGATAHDPQMPAAGQYIDRLADEIRQHVNKSSSLTEVLARSIGETARALAIVPGVGPSTTVGAVRVNPDNLEVLVLGDSAVILGFEDGSLTVHTDDRLPRLDLPESREYRRRLSHGHGYDDKHRSILRRLQAAERSRRNQPGGYWIAEADPNAAGHALQMCYPRDEVRWAIAATDGVTDLVPALGVDWPDVARMSTAELTTLLAEIHLWEAETDPDGQILPRAKRHDDKTVAVLRLK